MKEQIVLASGANGSELAKNLAMHNVNSFNMRIVGSGELARIALMRSGIAIEEDFLDFREEISIVAEAVKGVDYFSNLKYSDLQKITSVIRRIRTLVTNGDEVQQIENALKNGIFTEKNEALISVYKNYMKIIADRSLVDAVSLVRRALLECKSFDSDFYALEEYPLNPIEKALLQKLSNGKFTQISIIDLYNEGITSDTSLNIKSFKNCYGASNEVETILSDIYSSSEKSLDKCVVAVTDPLTYGQLFFDYALLYDIPITFGCGIPIINSNPAKLLRQYYHWMTSGFFGEAALKAMFSSDTFNKNTLMEVYKEVDKECDWKTYFKVLNELGSIRFTNDKAVNDKRLSDYKEAIKELGAGEELVPFIEKMSNEFSLPAEEFISKYVYIRKGNKTYSEKLVMLLDIAASKVVYEELKVINSSKVVKDVDDAIENVLKKVIASSSSEEGKLYVTGIEGALTSIRDNLYIAGLSASNYPGVPRENYLLLDNDLEQFGDEANYMKSQARINLKRDKLLRLTDLASCLGSEINVSYAGLNVSELKRDSASSLVFELCRKVMGEEATLQDIKKEIITVDYFEPAISITRDIGKAYVDGKIIDKEQKASQEDIDVKLNLDRSYSPSALDVFFGCKRRFMLKYVLGIREPDEDKPFEIIAANEIGEIAHSIMEVISDTSMSEKQFLSLSEKRFDCFIKMHPPLVSQNVEAERRQFLSIMGNTYNMVNLDSEVVLKEEDISCNHKESGVKIHGLPDRVEKQSDGSALIVDYKTGRKVKHIEDDIDTCLQIVLYAYLMEQEGCKVSSGEYLYTRLGEKVTCKYDEDMKKQLSDKLLEVKRHMENADFPIPDKAYEENREDTDDDPCKYCKFGEVCGK